MKNNPPDGERRVRGPGLRIRPAGRVARKPAAPEGRNVYSKTCLSATSPVGAKCSGTFTARLARLFRPTDFQAGISIQGHQSNGSAFRPSGA